METKKVLGIVFSLIFVGAFAFVLCWGIINFNKVKDGMSGTGVYTKEDINKSYEDGYNTALADKEEYTKLISSYRDTITTLNDNISQLNSQVTILQNNNKDYSNQIDKLNTQKSSLETQVNNLTTIKTNNETTIASLNSQITDLQKQVTNLTNSGEDKDEQIANLNSQIATLQNTVSQLQTTNDMNVATITSLNAQITNLNSQITNLTEQSQNSQSRINALNNKINELQASVTYYENYIKSLENGEQVVATFEYDGSVYNIQIVNKGSKLSVVDPTSTTYKIFNGWTVDGEPIDLSTYTITSSVKIIADITYKFDVKFMVDDEVYSSQIIENNSCATLPTAPSKEGYEFDGWSINGVDVLSDIATTQIIENTTYIAVFTKLYTVKYMYEDTVKSTQSIRNGEFSIAPTIESTTYKVFNGWKLGDDTVTPSTYKIYSDTTFVADITYKYLVSFISDNKEISSQIVEDGKFAVAPNDPQVEDKFFEGWTVDNKEIYKSSEINKIVVNSHITYTAIYTLHYFLSQVKLKGYKFIRGNQVFSINNNLYYCYADEFYKFNKITKSWEAHNFGASDFDQFWRGSDVWSDGTNYYIYSRGCVLLWDFEIEQWIISSDIKYMSSFYANRVWSDGSNTYYSLNDKQYYFNVDTLTWETIEWIGLTSFDGSNIWLDGANVYLSEGNKTYILDKATRTWSIVNWNNTPEEFLGSQIWIYNDEIFYTYTNPNSGNSYSYKLNKVSDTWEILNWKGASSDYPLYGNCVWTDGNNFYFSSSNGMRTYLIHF